MKVLMINSVCGIGSTGRICTDLYDALKEKNNECVIAYGRGKSSEKYKTYKIGNKLDNYIHLIGSRIFDKHGYYSKRATKKFINFIKEYQPDIIHIHNIHGYYLNIEILFEYLKREFRGKIIWTLHDCWSFSPHSAYIDYVDDKQLPIFENRKNLKKYPKSVVFNNSKRNLLFKEDVLKNIPNITLVTPSFWLKEMVSNSFLKSYNCEVINNGIDIGIFNSKGINKQDNEKKIILGVANIWEPRKGLDVFNELAEIIDDKYEIVLVGKIIKKNNINSKIKHIPQVTGAKEMAEFYKKATVFVNPTFEDNYPTTNLEAIACGVPIILFDTGGNKEMLMSDNSYLTKEKTAISIKKEIDYLETKKVKYSNDELLSIISKDKMYDKYINLFTRKE